MGMYCCCGNRITRDIGEGCTCDWNGWISLHDWPPSRKNKSLPFAMPVKEGYYRTRVQDSAGDRYEGKQYFSVVPRKEPCVFTGIETELHWEKNSEYQPYAWTTLEEESQRE